MSLLTKRLADLFQKNTFNQSTMVSTKHRMNGVLAGYETVDFKVTVVDGSYHEVDSSEMAFKIAGSMAFQDGAKKADPVLLEPIMKVSVEVPDEYLGTVMGNLTSRRGMLTGTESHTAFKLSSRSASCRNVRLCNRPSFSNTRTWKLCYGTS